MAHTGKTRGIKAKIILGFGIAALLAIMGGIIAYKSLSEMTSTVNRLAEPDRMLLKLQEILIGISEAESSIRAYTLDKDRQSLEPYFEFLNGIEEDVDTLYSLTSKNIRQQGQIDTLTLLLAEKIEIYSELIDIKDEQDQASVSDNILQKIKTAPQRVTSTTETTTPQGRPGFLNRFKNIFSGPEEKNPVEGEQEEPAQETTTRVVTTSPDIRKIVSEAKREEITLREQQRSRELNLLQRDMQVMSQIQDIIHKLEAEEKLVLETEAAAAKTVSNRATVVIATIIFTGIFCILIILFLIMNDITRANRYRQELVEAREEAEKLARVKEQLLANMSHEIRTPLNAILGFAEQLEKTELKKNQQDFLDAIHKSSELLLSTVNDILNFTKLDAGKLRMESIPYYIEEVVKETFDTLRIKADEKALKLEYHINDPLKQKVLLGDPLRLKQILINLVNNSIKFTEKGKVEITCTTIVEKESEIFTKIEVKDTGIGISKDKLQTIFEEFSQADSTITRKYGGTGLGLTIVKKLTELHGGNISVTSAEGKGSAFTVMLPLQKGTKYDKVVKEKPEELDVSRLQGLKVLLVDDDEMNQLLGKTILENWNINTAVAADGKEAIAKVKDDNYDLILMDLHMPELSGIDVTKYIRNMNPPKASVPIIAVTANIIKEDIDKCLKAGMDDYLLKPFKEAELFGKIIKNLRTTLKQKPVKMSKEEEPGNKMNTPGKGSNGALYNLSEIAEIAGDEKDFLIKMMETFIKSASNGITEMQKKMLESRYEEVGAVAHKLLPSYKHLAIDSVVPDLQDLELLSKGKGDKDKAAAELAHVVDVTNRVIADLRVEIEKIKEETA